MGLGFGAVCGQVKHGVALSAGLGSAEIGMGTGYVGHAHSLKNPNFYTNTCPGAQVTGTDLSSYFLAVAELEERCALPVVLCPK